MATSLIKDSQLRLIFENGLDEFGEMKYQNKNYNNIKVTATADQLYAVAGAITDLQSRELVDIERNDKHYLGE
ncbi:DUF1659 domain-containing protein [Fredinandcohnia sp. 179-A 10B2 NHS]|uniref:DUF1659 domain-containing protein n=1 Tax=Fredinandcohnia sp. 179-A 10B2 NHS TaxID=3235176 RepID=UPI0039A3F769